MPVSSRWPWIAAVLVLGGFLYVLHPILSPFLVGILIAYLGDPVVDRLERLKLSRTWGVIVVFSLFTLLMALALLVLIPMLGKQLVRLYELLPQMLDWVQNQALPWVQVRLGLNEGFWRFDQLKQSLSGHLGQTTDIAGLVLSQVTASSLALMAWAANLLLIPVVSFYLMRDWDLLVGKLRSLVPRDNEGVVVKLVGECHEVLGAFLRGQLLVMLALGAMYAFGLMAIGLELGLLIGVLAGLASIVPYLGVVVGLSLIHI